MTLDYDSLHVHRWMLRDGPRMAAFQRGIEAMVRPGAVVLDVGAGSGILSLMAARAGAARVYAVERTPVARLARQLVQRNGLAGVVRVLEADLQQLQLPEAVDLIVSEWLGTVGVDENLLYPVLLARDRWLKPGGQMLPARVRAMLAPAGLATACEIDYFRQRPCGFELGVFAEASMHELLCRRYQVRAEDLAAPPQQAWLSEMGSAALAEALAPHRAELSFELPRDCRINALVAWFEAELAPGLLLSNGPDAAETHWGQLMLPLNRALQLPAGSRLQVRLACLPRTPGLSDVAWALRVNGGDWELHDTRATAAGAHAVLPPGLPPAFSFSAGDAPMSKKSQHHGAPRASGETGSGPEPESLSGSAAAPPADSAPTVSSSGLPGAAEAAPLTRFLARLSVDIDLLHRLIRDPQAVIAEQGLADDDVAALLSREAGPIEQAMMKTIGEGAQP